MSQAENVAYEVLTNVLVPTASAPLPVASDVKAFHVKGSTTGGAGAATIQVEVSNNPTWPWLVVATINLVLGVAEVADGIVIDASWTNVRLNVTAISGTGAKVSGSIAV
jgi:hypothetical protein